MNAITATNEMPVSRTSNLRPKSKAVQKSTFFPEKHLVMLIVLGGLAFGSALVALGIFLIR